MIGFSESYKCSTLRWIFAMSVLKKATQLLRAPGRTVEKLVQYLDKHESDPYTPQGVDKMLYLFQSSEDLKDWVVQCDAEIGGKSVASLETAESGKARFFGRLNSETPEWLSRSGYATMYTKDKRKDAWFEVNRSGAIAGSLGYHGIEARVRGDGRRYKFNVFHEQLWRSDRESAFQFFMNTRGGPEYEIFRMPFNKFIRTGGGGYVQDQILVSGSFITAVGILLADSVDGPFNLEVDYIKFIHIPGHEEFDKMDRRKPRSTNLMTYEDL